MRNDNLTLVEERQRIAEINALFSKPGFQTFGMQTIRYDAIAHGWTIEEASEVLLDYIAHH